LYDVIVLKEEERKPKPHNLLKKLCAVKKGETKL